jgi:site-specific DNA recombinase
MFSDATERYLLDEMPWKPQSARYERSPMRSGDTLLDVISDPGVSGAILPSIRDGFADVLNMAAESQFAILLVWKIDRLARSLAHAVTTANDLREKYGVILRSVTEPIDTATPMGQTIFAILAGMATQERHVITERTLAGRKTKAENGGYAGGTPPYGYRSDGSGSLFIDTKEAETVRTIFELRDEGRTLREITADLNNRGVMPRRQGKWHPSSVRYILDNPRYRGFTEYFFRWGQVGKRVVCRGRHDPIVNDE